MRTLLIIIFFVSTFLSAQIPRRIWVHKANVRSDTIALIKNKVKSIHVYFIDYYFDTIPLKTHYATWELETSGTGILNSRIKFMDSTAYNFYRLVNFPKTTYRKKKIIESKDSTLSDARKLKMTHYLNREGKVTTSKLKYLGMRYEDSYSLLNKIRYEYNEKGLLTSANYINNWRTDDKNFCYLKVFFEYKYGP